LTGVTWDRVKICHGQSEKKPALRQRARPRTVSFTLEDISRRLLGMPVSSTLETDTVNYEKARTKAPEQLPSLLKLPKVNAH